jgi:hypothetical protein
MWDRPPHTCMLHTQPAAPPPHTHTDTHACPEAFVHTLIPTPPPWQAAGARVVPLFYDMTKQELQDR